MSNLFALLCTHHPAEAAKLKGDKTPTLGIQQPTVTQEHYLASN